MRHARLRGLALRRHLLAQPRDLVAVLLELPPELLRIGHLLPQPLGEKLAHHPITGGPFRRALAAADDGRGDRHHPIHVFKGRAQRGAEIDLPSRDARVIT